MQPPGTNNSPVADPMAALAGLVQKINAADDLHAIFTIKDSMEMKAAVDCLTARSNMQKFVINPSTFDLWIVLQFLIDRQIPHRIAGGKILIDESPEVLTIGCRRIWCSTSIEAAVVDPMSPGILMLDASTIGQVYARIAQHQLHGIQPSGFSVWDIDSAGNKKWFFGKDGLHEEVPQDVVFGAAGELHLMLAYAGKIPGVDPLVFSAWRVAKLAAYLDMTEDVVVDEIACAVRAIVDEQCMDLRSPFLEEAAARVSAKEMTDGENK